MKKADVCSSKRRIYAYLLVKLERRANYFCQGIQFIRSAHLCSNEFLQISCNVISPRMFFVIFFNRDMIFLRRSESVNSPKYFLWEKTMKKKKYEPVFGHFICCGLFIILLLTVISANT